MLALSLLVGRAQSQTFPPRPDQSYVSDSAGMISESDKTKITEKSQLLLKTVGAPIVVATIPSLDSVKAKNLGIEGYARALFDNWKIGYKDRNVGALLLVSRDDRKARIEFGGGWENRYNVQAHDVMSKAIIPEFKAGNFSKGILAGVNGIYAMAQKADAGSSGPQSNEPPVVEAVSQADSNPLNGIPSDGEGVSPTVAISVIVGLLVLLVLLLNRAMRTTSGRDYRRRIYGQPGATQDNVNEVLPGEATMWTVADNSSIHNGPSPTDFGGGMDTGGFDSGSGGGGGDSGSW
jgi:uncharacterized protein